jgi:hypothetical protein
MLRIKNSLTRKQLKMGKTLLELWNRIETRPRKKRLFY